MSLRMVVFCTAVLLSLRTLADGMVVDKVYHPYVLPNERELEWRLASTSTDEGTVLMQRLGYGHSVTESVAAEAYLIGESEDDKEFGLSAYEIEARWMITEQGRYWADWGMLFELEKEKSEDAWESAVALLMEKEIGPTSLTLNAFAIYEWGSALDNEWESEFRLKYRYRLKPQFQPAIEVYSGEDFVGVGPALMGIQRFNGQKQLKWELGYITEVAHGGKNDTFRMALEYEY